MSKRTRRRRTKSQGDFYTYDKNFVFYKRLNDDNAFQSNHWKKVHDTANSYFNKDLDSLEGKEIKRVANSLINKGKAERTKELNLFKEKLGISNIDEQTDYSTYINSINKIIGLRDDYEKLLRLMKQQAKGKNRATGAMSYFESYLQTTLTENIRKFIYSNKGKKSVEEYIEKNSLKTWEDNLERIIIKSFDDAIKKIGDRKDLLDDEELFLWKDIIKVLDKSEQQYKLLHSTIYTRYNLDNVKKELNKWFIGLTNTGTTKGLSTFIKKSYDMNEKSYRSAAGFMEEFVENMLPDKIEVAEGKNYYRSSSVMNSNMLKADSVQLYSENINLKLQELTDKMSSEITGNLNLTDARNQLETFYNEHLKEVDDLFITYTSSKLYSLGDSFRGFTGANLKGAGIIKFLNNVTNNKSEGQKAIRLLINCAYGTIGENQQEKVKMNITTMLSEYMAELLFDDWITLGKENNNAIHIFTLNNIKVPLSVLLIGAGQALLDGHDSLRRWFKIYYTIPDEIKKYKDETIKIEEGKVLKDYWIEQRNYSIKQTQLGVKFLGNFKQILDELIAKA